RVGEDFARLLLSDVAPACAALEDARKKADAAERPTLLLQEAELLEKGIFLAAHFGQTDHVHALVAHFQALLKALRGGEAAQAVESLAGQGFRGLRKLGLRDEIHALLGQMVDLVMQGKTLGEMRERKDSPAALRTLLHVASGWFYFGMTAEARPILEEA